VKREFLQLADTFDSAKHNIAGYLISEKLDGTRCFWDGGVTRGLPTRDVPWANITDPKTGQPKAKVKPIATGLWSRYGNPIIAPDKFLNALPACPLDGELWAGRGNFQLCRSICAGDTPDPRFHLVSYAVYSTPSPEYLFMSGEINNANMTMTFALEEIQKWFSSRLMPGYMHLNSPATFNDELMFLRGALETQNDFVFLHQQTRLPEQEEDARQFMETFLDKVLSQGGEGCILRNPLSTWTPRRHKGILKYKPFQDAEGTIVGFTSGRETDKGSRLLGKIGALILDYEGQRLELSGLTDAEREFLTPEMAQTAVAHPGEDMPTSFQGRHFTVGQIVTFKYRELTDDNIPKEARFWRQRNEE
jgi:DNA ligase-1